jgi:CRP-like cAMP-binding protein
MFIIQDGKVGVSIEPDSRIKKFVAEMGPKECFGEMGLFDDQPRSATIHVIEDCTLLSLDKGKLRALVIRHPELALGLLRTLSLRLREANRRD